MSKRQRNIYVILALLILSVLSACTVFVYDCIDEIFLDKYEKRSYVLYSDKGNVLAYTLSDDNSSLRFKTTKDDVSDLYLKMLIANEDKRFYSHIGVDPLSLCRAIFYNLKNQSVGSGASTLAM